MSTFQRTANQAAPEVLHSSGSAPKSTPSRLLSSSTDARSAGAHCAWILQKTAPARPGSGEISADRPAEDATTSVAPDRQDRQSRATAATTSPATEATTIAAVMTAVAARRSTSRSDPKAVGAVCAARSAASSRSFHTHTAKNTRARCEPRPSARCVVPPRSVNLDLPIDGLLISRRQSYGKGPELRLSTSILGHNSPTVPRRCHASNHGGRRVRTAQLWYGPRRRCQGDGRAWDLLSGNPWISRYAARACVR